MSKTTETFMDDDPPIAGLIVSLRAAVEIVKELRDLRVPSGTW
jgi:hypothetical protein